MNQMFSLWPLSLTVASLHPQVNDTRVILQDTDPDVVGSDYINANYVRVSLQSHFIETQSDNNKTQNRKLSEILVMLLVFKVVVVYSLESVQWFTVSL